MELQHNSVSAAYIVDEAQTPSSPCQVQTSVFIETAIMPDVESEPARLRLGEEAEKRIEASWEYRK